MSSTIRKEASAEQYDREYYLHQCSGFVEYDSLVENLYLPIFPHHIYQEARQLGLSNSSLQADKLMLDIGCGRGEMLALYAAQGWLTVGLDFSFDALTISKELYTKLPPEVAARISLVCVDAKRLCFEDNSVDVVLMLDFVEHVPQNELKKIMADAYRVLRPGGILIVHTQPTVNFIKYGQHIYRLLNKLTGRPVPGLISFESEERIARHCNIHSKKSLEEAVQSFPNHKVYSNFSVNTGLLKKLLLKTGLINYLTRNLWVLGYK